MLERKRNKRRVDLKGGYLPIPNDFRGKGLTYPALMVFSWVYMMYLSSDWIKISNTNLAERLELPDKTFRRAKKELQDLGLIKVTSIPGGVSEYEVQIDRMCEFFNLKEETSTPAGKENKSSQRKKTSKPQGDSGKTTPPPPSARPWMDGMDSVMK